MSECGSGASTPDALTIFVVAPRCAFPPLAASRLALPHRQAGRRGGLRCVGARDRRRRLARARGLLPGSPLPLLPRRSLCEPGRRPAAGARPAVRAQRPRLRATGERRREPSLTRAGSHGPPLACYAPSIFLDALLQSPVLDFLFVASRSGSRSPARDRSRASRIARPSRPARSFPRARTPACSRGCWRLLRRCPGSPHRRRMALALVFASTSDHAASGRAANCGGRRAPPHDLAARPPLYIGTTLDARLIDPLRKAALRSVERQTRELWRLRSAVRSRPGVSLLDSALPSTTWAHSRLLARLTARKRSAPRRLALATRRPMRRRVSTVHAPLLGSPLRSCTPLRARRLRHLAEAASSGGSTPGH